MLSTARFYVRSTIYRSQGLRNCRMLIYICWAFCIIDLISILIRSNHSIRDIFLSKSHRDFILVSRPMFLTLRNLSNIVSGSYHPSNSLKSNMAAVHNEVNHKIIITQQALKIEISFWCLDPCFWPQGFHLAYLQTPITLLNTKNPIWLMLVMSCFNLESMTAGLSYS
jgi:hypothetical protein